VRDLDPLALARVELLDGWSIELEEGYSREVELDGTVMLSNNETTIRTTTEGPADRGLREPASASDMLGDDLGEPHELPDGTLVAVGEEFEEDIDGAPAWGLPVAAARPNELLSLYFHSHSPGLFAWVPAAAETIAYRESGIGS
jgi:hypothetical protein